MTEDKMVGWYHQLNGHEFEQTLGAGERQGSWQAAVHGVAKSWTRLSDLTTKNRGFYVLFLVGMNQIPLDFFFHFIIVQKLCKPDSVSSSEYLFKLYQIFNSHVRKKVLTMIKYLLNVIYQTLSQNGKFKI